MDWKYIKKLNNSDSVVEFLKKYKVRLPEELISIIKSCNGGRPSFKDLITASKKEYVFKSLLSYNEDDLDNIYSVYPILFKGTGLYPVAIDSAGNYVCYDLNKHLYVIWMHETNGVDIIVNIHDVIGV